MAVGFPPHLFLLFALLGVSFYLLIPLSYVFLVFLFLHFHSLFLVSSDRLLSYYSHPLLSFTASLLLAITFCFFFFSFSRRSLLPWSFAILSSRAFHLSLLYPLWLLLFQNFGYLSFLFIISYMSRYHDSLSTAFSFVASTDPFFTLPVSFLLVSCFFSRLLRRVAVFLCLSYFSIPSCISCSLVHFYFSFSFFLSRLLLTFFLFPSVLAFFSFLSYSSLLSFASFLPCATHYLLTFFVLSDRLL